MSRVSEDAVPGYICFAGQDWWYHNQAHSDFQLMRHVARERAVLVVNSIGVRMPTPGTTDQPLRRILRKARSVGKLLRRPLPDLPGFWVFSPLVLPLYGSAWARALNVRLIRMQVAVAARRAGIKTPVYVVTIPTAWEVVQGLPRRSLVFNRSDKYSAMDDADAGYLRGVEDALLRSSDVIVYASHALMEEELPLAGERANFLDHGVDLDHFDVADGLVEPADLQAIARPRVGFFGAIDGQVVDLALVERVAREVPEAQLVLVGSSDQSLDALQRLPNVHWLGFKSYEQIPAYGAGFDVALMPWLDNEWIRCCNPIKLKEYLALGLPIVTTPFPEVEQYRELVAIARGPEAFVAAVRAALVPDGPTGPAARRAAVAGDSWASRARELIAVAEQGGGQAPP